MLEAEVPANVHLLKLHAYSPELNPIGKLWSIVKDANRICDLTDKKGWLVAQANATRVLLIA